MISQYSLFFLLFVIIFGIAAEDVSNSTLQNYEHISPQIRKLKPGNNVNRLLFSFKAFGHVYTTVLSTSHIPVESNFKIIINQNGTIQPSEILQETDFYSGHIEGYPFSRVFLSINRSDVSNINGFIEFENDTLILEPLPNTNFTLIYKSSDVKIDRENSVGAVDFSNTTQTLGESQLPERYFEKFVKKKTRRHTYEYIRKNRCELKLVADYEFYRVIGHGNYAQSARYLINLIERVNSIFTKVDWGIDIQGRRLSNLGFSIKEIHIMDTPNELPKHFNSKYSEGNSVSASEMLGSFSDEQGSFNFCAVVLVSAKLFDHGVLGLANVANFLSDNIYGLCATADGIYRNTGVLTIRNRAGLLITRLVDLVFAHELGHLWGASHDDETSEECVPKNDKNGRYIMFASSNSGYDRNNYEFSPCSIRQIQKILYALADQCFKEEQRAFCGNGIVEDGEMCDAGDKVTNGEDPSITSLAKRDPCCTEHCQLRENAFCSPKHSECCTLNCTYSAVNQKCRPESKDTCRRESFCTGINDQCPEPRPLEDGTFCVEEGRCRGGECIPYCQIINPNYRPCICEKVDESCLRCCKDGDDGVCYPHMPHNKTRYLPEGSICIHGHCRNNTCEKEVTDLASHLWNIIRNWRESGRSKFFHDYFGFFIIFGLLLFWIPLSYIVDRQDRKKVRDRAALRQLEGQGLIVVPGKKSLNRPNQNYI